nr:integrase, catalytic region, zinc finger, CCHC-type, peptidase aspartic, catalytic [Tanacetum cinerariifolium]
MYRSQMLHESPSPYQSQTSQRHSVNRFNVKDVQDLDPFFGRQDYSPTQGSGGPSVPVGDDFLTEEVMASEGPSDAVTTKIDVRMSRWKKTLIIDSEVSVSQEKLDAAQENRLALDAEQLLFLAGGQDNVFDDDVDEQPVHDLALNVDNVFQADDCDAFDSNVDEAPTAQTMFMANLSSADPVTDEAEPSYDSDILSEVPDYEHCMDAACAHHEGHVTHDNIQLDHFVDSHADYTSDSHMIPYDQYVRDNENPLCLTRAKQVQPTLYIGHEIIKDNHTPTIVHNSEDTLEISEITRKKMNDKMNDPECVTRKVKI